MVDSGKVLRDYLLSLSAITSLVATDVNSNPAIYVGDDLPEGFDPKNGPGILISRRGGRSHPEIPALKQERVQIKCAADVENYLAAYTLYGAVYDNLHGLTMSQTSDGTIISAQETVAGQEMTDPDTGWCYVVCFYNLVTRS